MNKFINVAPPLLAGLLSLSAVTSSHAAGSISGEIAVKLVIGAGCNVENVPAGATAKWGDVDFGTQANLKNIIDASVTDAGVGPGITVSCSTGLAPSLKINGGLNAAGTLRNVKSGSTLIPYRLYADSGHTKELSIDTPVTFLNPGTAPTTKVQIFGRILPGDQSGALTPAAGAYTDTVLATIAW